MTTLQRILTGTVVVGAVGAVVFAWSFRTKYAPVQDRVRRFNRDHTNRQVLRRAGTAGADETVVGHVGRTSGTAYRTPVVAEPIEDGFVIALPYGPTADWVRNVRAAGSALLERDGHRYEVSRPRLVGPDEAAAWFGAGERRLQAVFGVTDFLVLEHASSA